MNYQNVLSGAIISATDLNKITIGRDRWLQTSYAVTHQVEVVIFPKEEAVRFGPAFHNQEMTQPVVDIIPSTDIILKDGLQITGTEGLPQG